MAIMYPKVITSDATVGEKRVFNILKTALPDSYYVWFNARINNRYPDFIIMEAELGIVVLEVKDWELNSVSKADKNLFYTTSNEAKKNPIEQAREYTLILINEFKKSQALVQQSGKYSGNLLFTYGHGAILCNLSRDSFIMKFGNVFDDDFVIYKEGLYAIENDVVLLEERLRRMFPTRFDFSPLSKNQMDEIKRILNGQLDFEAVNKESVCKVKEEREVNSMLMGDTLTKDGFSDGKKKAHGITLKKKSYVILVVCLILILSIFKVIGADRVSEVNSEFFNNNSSTSNEKFTSFEGYIECIEKFDNGAVRLNINNGLESWEVYIGKDIGINQNQFVLDSEYKFTGEIVDYNGTIQIHPQKTEDIILIQQNNFFPVVVTKIIDGDTIYVLDDNGVEIKVRLIGMDCPELGSVDESGEQASQYTEKILFDKTVFLEKDTSEVDKYGRALRYVWLDLPDSRDIEQVRDKMANAKLIVDGYAKVATYPPDVRYEKIFLELQ
ncbi:thermonuclease family protein [Anaerotignum propionicum]|uniref:Nuclease-related domain-containing protein n=1 Tax=Anaerotignum propionicum DSM 1682 TaxID=991789 RepID=A0A0X1U931_ANAPI|nr:thermonuclease family protein [Anaerotignum propionicum]AMJ41446.1 thermonuclease precursor [Anaerotignum propionicum DSM 1682]SHE68633.1 Nuclease-related domain-containing protein [[Clostridium] propionicum DSM 1682] [Anaerotignum propionicum DSM 1682]